MSGTIVSQINIPGTEKVKGRDKTHGSNPTTYRLAWRHSVEKKKKRDHRRSGFFPASSVLSCERELRGIWHSRHGESPKESCSSWSPNAYDDNQEPGADVRGAVWRAEITREESLTVVFSSDYRPGARAVEIHSMGRKRDASNT